MTAKDKAEELIRKYYTFGINKEGQSLSWYECKQCALIAVDEQINEYQSMSDLYTYLSFPERENENSVILRLVYWQEVKQEIEKL